MAKSAKARLDAQLIEAVVDQLRSNRPVRRVLPGDGLVNIDRQLPFLFVYRPPAAGPDPLFARLMAGGASYLLAPSGARARAWTAKLVASLVETLSAMFGAFLVVELWPCDEVDAEADSVQLPKPSFTLFYGMSDAGSTTVDRLAAALGDIVVMKQRANVDHVVTSRVAPEKTPSLLSASQQKEMSTTLLGVEVNPIYRDPSTSEMLPLVGRALAPQVSRALQQAAFQFARTETNDRSMHYHALGRRTFVAAAKRVDAQLSEVAEAFDLLLSVTPANAEAAYRFFRRSKFQRAPRFHYRPIAVDPDLLRRRLWNVPIERVEDMVLEQVFREKRRELALKLTLLAERERPQFLPTSTALYGRMNGQLLTSATTILDEISPESGTARSRKVSATDFIARAQREIDRLRSTNSRMDGRIVVRDDVTSLMVSSGNLIVGSQMSFPSNRVEPLIQHEVGTHVLTYWNGRAQPFHLLATGLAGHDELQEGLAVFVEYLVGGLTPQRLRTLAGRVVAVASLLDGASFVETFRILHDDHGFGPRAAFNVAMRVHRGGGLTKDAVYLRGIGKVVDYLARGGRLDTLFVGKIATEHASVIEELQRRQVLEPPPFRPSYLDQPDAHYRIERIKANPELIDLTDA